MEYNGHTIPESKVGKSNLLGVLSGNSCDALCAMDFGNSCSNIKSCSSCILNSSPSRTDESYATLIEYGIEHKYITKGQGMKFLLDRSQ